MAGTLNKVFLMGNITRDIELRYIPSGTAVVSLGLAVNDRYKKGEEWVEAPVFVDVTIWGRTAEVAAEYLSKGSPVLIEGRLKLDQWETQDGERRNKLTVVCERMQLLGNGNGEGGGKKPAKATKTPDTSSMMFNDDPEDDIPF